ncbi:Isochorismatase-like protein [Chaetomium sp. MPI-SDFR-AT-0129]|nr:Isochorismatase-like protein [Chaetomium sp. MPI-SDFR-AT-0129]
MATALFVIDIQNDLATDPNTKIPHSDRIRAAGGKILSSARTALESNTQGGSRPSLIVFVQHEESPESGSLVRGSEPWKLVFEPRAGSPKERLVPKSTRSTFESNLNLASELQAAGVKEIVAFGIQSECCVESTCNGALEAGFGVTVLSGAHSTYDDSGKPAVDIEREVEARLKTKGAKIVPWENVIAGWE